MHVVCQGILMIRVRWRSWTVAGEDMVMYIGVGLGGERLTVPRLRGIGGSRA